MRFPRGKPGGGVALLAQPNAAAGIPSHPKPSSSRQPQRRHPPVHASQLDAELHRGLKHVEHAAIRELARLAHRPRPAALAQHHLGGAQQPVGVLDEQPRVPGEEEASVVCMGGSEQGGEAS